MGGVRSHTGRRAELRISFAPGAVCGLATTLLERVGDQLRLYASNANGAGPAEQLAKLEGVGARLVREGAEEKPAMVQIVAETACGAWGDPAGGADFAFGGVTLRLAARGSSTLADVLAASRAGVCARESTACFAALWGAVASAGAARVRAGGLANS